MIRVNTVFSPRLLEILRVLASTQEYVTTQALAESVGVSARTVFRELENINTFLKSYGVSVEAKTGHGYQLVGDQTNRDLFLKNIEATRKPLTYTNPDERRQLLILECLKNRQITKLSTLAYMLEVSEGTISRDLEIIEPWFEKYELKLLRRQGYGVSVLGDEENVRKAITDYVHERIEMGIESAFDSFNLDAMAYFNQQQDGILGLINKDVLIKVISVLEQSSVNIAKKITQHSYIGLIIHLAIAIERIQNNELIEMDPSTLTDMKKESMFKEARIIATDIEDRFQIRFPEAEVGYIYMHLQGTRPRHLQTMDRNFQDNYEALTIANRLIERFSNLLKEDYSYDEALRSGLMAHLKPTLNRLKYNLEIRNPLLAEIYDQYYELFEIVKETTKILYLEYQFHLSDDEIGYLTMHFGAAIERQKHQSKNKRHLNIGVVCASGIGISTLLASKLKNTFLDAKSIEPYSVYDLNTQEMAGVDLIVSTIYLDTERPVVYVNPLLKNEDVLNIRKAMDTLTESYTPKYTQTTALNVELIESMGLVEADFSKSRDEVIVDLILKLPHGQYEADKIYKSVLEREENGPVVIVESKFVMYHASVPGLLYPEILFFRNTATTKHEAYKDLEIGVLMVIPNPARKVDRKTMSKVTESIIDNPKVLEAVLTLDKEKLIEQIVLYE